MSRLRATATKDTSKVIYANEHYHEDKPDEQSYRNGSRENRYHFGMTRHDETTKNGRDKEETEENPDLLYRRSREHFVAWDIKDIVQDEPLKPRKLTDRFDESRLTNGKSKADIRQDCEAHVETLDRRTQSIDRDENVSQRSRKKDTWENPEPKSTSRTRSRNNGNKDNAPVDERDLLLREIESLAVDGKSPDRRIRAMIERFKSREEDKSRSRKEATSLSPERDEPRAKTVGRNDLQADRNERSGRIKIPKDEDERRSARLKTRESERLEGEVGSRRSRSREKFNDGVFSDKEEDSRNVFKEKTENYVDRSHRRKSRDPEEEQPRARDNSKRRSYVYEGSPEEFDVRIQRYERVALEPRKDSDLTRKESLKEQDRQVSRKSSFKTSDSRRSSKERESSLSRKTSEGDTYRKNCLKTQDVNARYFGKDEESDLCRKNSLKEPGLETGRRNSFKEQNSDYGKIYFKRDDDVERKNSLKGQASVSRISFKELNDERMSYRDGNPERVCLKDRSDLGRRNSLKEKTVEFGGISYKDDDVDVERRNVYKDEDNECGKLSVQTYEEPERRRSPNGRYEFGKVSFKDQDEEAGKDYDRELERKSSLKERDSTKRRVSIRNKDGLDKKSNRHSRPLTPPKKGVECRDGAKEQDESGTKCWHESNRLFAINYLKDNSKVQNNCEARGKLNCELTAESSMPVDELGDKKYANEVLNDDETKERRSESHNFGNRNNTSRDTDSTYTSTHERNGATIIRIRTSPENPIERRRRRRPVQDLQVGRRRRYEMEDDEGSDEDEDEDDDVVDVNRQRSRRDDFIPGRGVPTPSRRIWNYREGGVLITDIEEGQPCLECGERCPGFWPHSWRWSCDEATPVTEEDSKNEEHRIILNDKLQRRHTTPTLLAKSGLRMSPKGPSQEEPKMEVRVSCVPSPGAEPQGIRVRIPEPKKRPMSPPLQEIRNRCPSVSEKDFYRKTASLDRRDRYPTLSGAEIKRGLIPGSLDAPRGKRNPMLDRKNRFPTISGAELKRSLAIGKCPLEDGLDLSLVPWPGMKWACVRVLHLYCKVFDQFELFELIVRKNCTGCKCPREAHEVCHEEWVSVRSRLGLKGDESTSPVGFDPREKGLAWAPPGLPAHKVEEYFSKLPAISVPRLGTPGERHRDRQLAIQLPKQDLARAYCRHLNPEYASSADDFMAARNEIALDIGSVQEVIEWDLNCGACNAPLKYGSLAVFASKLGLLCHPACFRCTDCKELLVDLAYCVHDDTLFCERHYAEQLKPRCAACDEVSTFFIPFLVLL